MNRPDATTPEESLVIATASDIHASFEPTIRGSLLIFKFRRHIQYINLNQVRFQCTVSSIYLASHVLDVRAIQNGEFGMDPLEELDQANISAGSPSSDARHVEAPFQRPELRVRGLNPAVLTR